MKLALCSPGGATSGDGKPNHYIVDLRGAYNYVRVHMLRMYVCGCTYTWRYFVAVTLIDVRSGAPDVHSLSLSYDTSVAFLLGCKKNSGCGEDNRVHRRSQLSIARGETWRKPARKLAP